MRQIGRSTLAGILVVGMCNLPILGSSEKPLGIIAQAEHAHLDSASAATGATVYAGDTFDTETGGTLRLRVGASQFYLLGSSAAKLAQSSSGAVLTISRGTAGFSSAASGQLLLDTPAGIVRGAEGKPAYGQVTINSPTELIVSAFRGDLVVDNEGELHSIPEGKTYRVEIAEDQEPAPTDNKDFQPARKKHSKRRVAFLLIFGGGMTVLGYELYNHLNESNSDPRN
jgi:hypothetical protein